jgi:ABC-type proline/glycine betaine transport system permease subunit
MGVICLICLICLICAFIYLHVFLLIVLYFALLFVTFRVKFYSFFFFQFLFILCLGLWGPLMVAQWLKYWASSRKVAGSIPDGVIGIFH